MVAPERRRIGLRTRDRLRAQFDLRSDRWAGGRRSEAVKAKKASERPASKIKPAPRVVDLWSARSGAEYVKGTSTRARRKRPKELPDIRVFDARHEAGVDLLTHRSFVAHSCADDTEATTWRTSRS